MPQPIFQVQLTGMQELMQNMQGLPEKVMVNVLKAGAKQGGEVIREAIADKAPSLAVAKKHGAEVDPPGFLKTQVRVAVLAKSQAGIGNIGVRIGLTLQAFYGRMVELGHRIGRRGLRLARRKNIAANIEFGTQQVAAHPYMRPAFEESWQEALDAMAKGCREKLDRLDLSSGVSHAEQSLLGESDTES